MWILDATRANGIELIEKFLSLVNELFQPPKSNNPTEGNKEQMKEKFRSSLHLSVVILLIAVRAQNARITIISAKECKNKPHYLINSGGHH